MVDKNLFTVLRLVFVFASTLHLEVTAKPPHIVDCNQICLEKNCTTGICGQLYLECYCDTHSEELPEPLPRERFSILDILLPVLFAAGAAFVIGRFAICLKKCLKKRKGMAREQRIPICDPHPRIYVNPMDRQRHSLLWSTGQGSAADITTSSERNAYLGSNNLLSSSPSVEDPPTYKEAISAAVAAAPYTASDVNTNLI